MSVAAKEVVLIGQILGELSHMGAPLIDVVPTFLGRLGAVLADPWAVAAQGYVYETSGNERPRDFAEKIKFQAAARLAAEDASVHQLMTELAQLPKPSRVLRESPIAERLARALQEDSL